MCPTPLAQFFCLPNLPNLPVDSEGIEWLHRLPTHNENTTTVWTTSHRLLTMCSRVADRTKNQQQITITIKKAKSMNQVTMFSMSDPMSKASSMTQSRTPKLCISNPTCSTSLRRMEFTVPPLRLWLETKMSTQMKWHTQWGSNTAGKTHTATKYPKYCTIKTAKSARELEHTRRDWVGEWCLAPTATEETDTAPSATGLRTPTRRTRCAGLVWDRLRVWSRWRTKSKASRKAAAAAKNKYEQNSSFDWLLLIYYF